MSGLSRQGLTVVAEFVFVGGFLGFQDSIRGPSHIENYIAKQMDRINKMQSRRGIRAVLSIGLQRHQYEATVIVRGPGINLVSKNKHSNPYKTIDGAVDKALGQLNKIKGKRLSSSRRRKVS